MLDRIEPSMDVWTIRSWPWVKAMMPTCACLQHDEEPQTREVGPTMASTALPKVAFNKPPTVWPTFNATCSVASPNKPASGMMARKEMTKSAVAPQPAKWEANESGTAMRTRLSQDEKKRLYIDLANVGSPSCAREHDEGERGKEKANGWVRRHLSCRPAAPGSRVAVATVPRSEA